MDESPPRKWTLERWIAVAAFIGSAIAIVFGLGAQWARTTYLEAEQKATTERLKTEFVRTDVYAADRRELAAAIDRLTRALEQQPTPPQRGRMFDR